MNPEARKTKFVTLLQELLEIKCGGIKSKLAKQLKVGNSRISRWLQGQVDPLNLETLVFSQIAQLKQCSHEELAKTLGLTETIKSSQEKFQILLEEMLSDKTQDQVAEIIGVSQFTISNWLNPENNIDPGKLSVGNMLTIAHEIGWTFDSSLMHLGLAQKSQEKFFIEYQSELLNLSLAEKKELSIWLSNLINKIEDQEKYIEESKEANIKDFQIDQYPQATLLSQKILIILEQDDVAIASNYFSNLVEYLNFKAKNIKIATIPKLPQSLADIDILIFDINTADSPSIQLIEDLTFNGDIIIFADAIALPLIRARISSAVSEIFAKPVDWSAKQIFSLFSK